MSQSHDPAASVGLQFWRTTLRWQRHITDVLKPFGLTHVQFVLLASTWWLTQAADERPSQQRLADHAGTEKMMTSQVVRTLASKGLVVREPDPDDSRAFRLSLTAEGSALAIRAVHAVEAADAAFFGAVSDRAALLDTLRELA